MHRELIYLQYKAVDAEQRAGWDLTGGSHVYRRKSWAYGSKVCANTSPSICDVFLNLTRSFLFLLFLILCLNVTKIKTQFMRKQGVQTFLGEALDIGDSKGFLQGLGRTPRVHAVTPLCDELGWDRAVLGYLLFACLSLSHSASCCLNILFLETLCSQEWVAPRISSIPSCVCVAV